jgi:glycine cleavage system H protein
MTALFVVSTIIIFLTIDWVVQRLKQERAVAHEAVRREGTYPLRIPAGVFFARSHTWLNLFPSGKVRLGVDDFVGSLLEDPQVCLIKQVGDAVEKGEAILTLNEDGKFLTIHSPISGKIVSVNDALEDDSKSMRERLFSHGWAYTIQPSVSEELKDLMLGEETRSWMFGEFRRLRDLLAGAWSNGSMAPAAIQDGGAPIAGALRHLEPGAWSRIEEEFLRVD